jgi:alpha-galactosidase
MTITTHAQHAEALEGAAFVISAIEVGAREDLWKQDFQIPLKYGVRQPYAENGGPGGFAHAARNLTPVMEIVRDMEQTCPDAWFINFTNPMIRICDAINRHSRIQAVGLCHQIYAGYIMVGVALGKDLGLQIPQGLTGVEASADQAPFQTLVKQQIVPRVDIRAAGLNHFTWILSIRDRQNGEDLYPLFRQRWADLNPDFEPLTRRVFDTFGWFPVPGDTHLSEYLPWLSDPITRPWEKYHLKLYDWDQRAQSRQLAHEAIRRMARGEAPIAPLLDTDSEGAAEIIETVAGEGTHYHLAANRPNEGQIANLPSGATVETPVEVDGAGIHPVQVGAVPGPIAELLRRETTVAQLCVEAALSGDRQQALQCLLLDPVIRDIEQAGQILEDYFQSYREYLPQFWK